MTRQEQIIQEGYQPLSDCSPITERPSHQKYLKWAVGRLLLIIIGLTSYFSDRIMAYIIIVLNWAENIARQPGGPILFTIMYTAATVMFLPGGLICVGIGFAFSRAYNSMGCKRFTFIKKL